MLRVDGTYAIRGLFFDDFIKYGTRETGVYVLVLTWTTSQFFDDDEWNVLFKCHVM